MHLRVLVTLLTGLCLLAGQSFAQLPLTILANSEPQPAKSHRLAWSAIPEHRYEVQQTADFQTWSMVPGFPIVADRDELEVTIRADDDAAFFRLVKLDEPAFTEMALIPSGPFQMGDALNDSTDSDGELPVHTVHVSAFLMDAAEVSGSLWQEVYAWALKNGYGFDNPGAFKATDHPVHTVNWYDAVKWCNARSEKAGLETCYYTDASLTNVYRTGRLRLVSEFVKWKASGYRLPTEAEWEKAARGGLTARRFPWGNTITHGHANYVSIREDAYDLSLTRGYHPAYFRGRLPATNPRGSFAANGYGLFDMAGNLREWVWDVYDKAYYSQSGATEDDPHGSTITRFDCVVRGGVWNHYAATARCSGRYPNWPNYAFSNVGFRCVKSP